jgi:spectinomycin phosphotransferase
VHVRPDIDDGHLTRALHDGWAIAAVAVEFVPLGFGSHHWVVTDRDGVRRFVTVDDLDRDGLARDEVFGELERAFETARALQEAGLELVVAPIPTGDGTTVRHLSAQHTIAVFPYVDGRASSWGDVLDAADRAALVEVLAALHEATECVRAVAPRRDVGPIARSVQTINEAIAQVDDPWTGGPFAEPTRRWLLDRRSDVQALVDETARLMAQVELTPESLVVTHGEPHPGNVIRAERGLVLIDWDTVGLAPPERDLWLVGGDDDLAHYTEITGRPVDRNAIALYRNAWTLADVATHSHLLRLPHVEDDDTTTAWRTLEGLDGNLLP